MILYHQKQPRLVQWVIWYEEFVVESGVHAAAYQACAPQLAVFKLRYSQNRNCQLRRTYSIHISKVPLFRASVDPSGNL
jgi:hypothetical protein